MNAPELTTQRKYLTANGATVRDIFRDNRTRNSEVGPGAAIVTALTASPTDRGGSKSSNFERR